MKLTPGDKAVYGRLVEIIGEVPEHPGNVLVILPHGHVTVVDGDELYPIMMPDAPVHHDWCAAINHEEPTPCNCGAAK